MSLYLVEEALVGLQSEQITAHLEQVNEVATKFQSRLIEAQVGEHLQHLWIILEAPDSTVAQQILVAAAVTPLQVKPVRLIGQDLDTVQVRRGKANYLVEWNLPAGLTMEAYLARKAEKSPLYAQVPEVQFERTYVCEDVSKCLCFYDSPDAKTVQLAREVVGAPIDTLTTIRSVH